MKLTAKMVISVVINIIDNDSLFSTGNDRIIDRAHHHNTNKLCSDTYHS